MQMERVELQTKIFIGGDGANGNEGINRADTVVNDAVIDLDNQRLRESISHVELSAAGVERRHGVTATRRHGVTARLPRSRKQLKSVGRERLG